MKLIIGLFLILTSTVYGQRVPAIEPSNVQVDVVAPADSRITVQRIAPYSIVLTNNTTHDITGLAVEWAAGGLPQTLLLGHYGFKQPVVRVKDMILLRPPNDITAIPVNMDGSGRR